MDWKENGIVGALMALAGAAGAAIAKIVGHFLSHSQSDHELINKRYREIVQVLKDDTQDLRTTLARLEQDHEKCEMENIELKGAVERLKLQLERRDHRAK